MTDNNWTKVTIKVSRETQTPLSDAWNQDKISNILIAAGANGVEIGDTQVYLDYEPTLSEVLPEIEQSDNVEVSAYYPDEQVSPEFLSSLSSSLRENLEIDFELSTDSLAEEDWANAWKQYFQPTRISRDLTIVPSWTDYQPSDSTEKLIKLDPGMAFGTGTHPTTKLSLYALEQVLRGGETVLDVGTGSGVLSIAASLLGALDIYAYDLDDVAVRVARENIELNPETAQKIHVAAGDLLNGVTQEADVIVANILADILLQMLDDAYRLVKAEGTLILSGIISGKCQQVLDKAEAAGFQLETQMQQGEWHCLVLKKSEKELFFG
ncbi:MAG: 50S ribosomal protein L11 methyltransferase [Streptococcaceae bacterium]|jgi:ribosomal protein L11 methyltransferase|nr:50S ribosomal protein L11 methyltransferase [Streptococcaceae bacterium]